MATRLQCDTCSAQAPAMVESRGSGGVCMRGRVRARADGPHGLWAHTDYGPWRAASLRSEAPGAAQVLQLYAAQALGGGGGGGGGGGDAQAAEAAGPAEAAVQALLGADEERWDALLQEAAAGQVRVPVSVGFSGSLPRYIAFACIVWDCDTHWFPLCTVSSRIGLQGRGHATRVGGAAPGGPSAAARRRRSAGAQGVAPDPGACPCK
jgi:hypothetical protein